MVMKFNNFIFEKKLEYFLYSVDENLSFPDFKEKIIKFIPNIKTKEQAKHFLLNIVNKFKPKKVFLYFLIKMILTINLITTVEIFDLFKGSPYETVVTQYRKFMKPKNEFIAKLFQRESSGRPNIVKKAGGYIGGFQFSKKALKDIGKGHITAKKFKKNPKMFSYPDQVKALSDYMKKNEYYLRDYMDYIGKIINGIEITKSGMLAAAHLVGQKKVKKFLTSNGKQDPHDGNGTKCSTYMSEFSGYDVE